MIEVRCQRCNHRLMDMGPSNGYAEPKCPNCSYENKIWFTTSTNDLEYKTDKRVIFTGEA